MTALEKKEKKLSLQALDEEDLAVISVFTQDCIVMTDHIKWARKQMKFYMRINRFRWENHLKKGARKQKFCRVNSLLSFHTVLGVKSRGLCQFNRNVVLSLLNIKFKKAENENGCVELIFAGDGRISLLVECLDLLLKDISEPFKGMSSKDPMHPLEE